MKNLENFHVLKASYLGPTNTKGSRVKIESERFKQKIIIPYNYEFAYTLPIAQKHLEKLGFELIGQAEGKNCYYLISSTFKPLRK